MNVLRLLCHLILLKKYKKFHTKENKKKNNFQKINIIIDCINCLVIRINRHTFHCILLSILLSYCLFFKYLCASENNKINWLKYFFGSHIMFHTRDTFFNSFLWKFKIFFEQTFRLLKQDAQLWHNSLYMWSLIYFLNTKEKRKAKKRERNAFWIEQRWETRTIILKDFQCACLISW